MVSSDRPARPADGSVRFPYVGSPQKRKDFRYRSNYNNKHERDGTIENDSPDQRRQNHRDRINRIRMQIS